MLCMLLLAVIELGASEKSDGVYDSANKDVVISSDDSLSVSLDEIVIETNSVSRTAPIAISTLDSRTLQRNNNGQDLPYLLGMTPSLVTTSDNGLGIGLTSFRIRGTDASRINLTYDGVALNSPEDQTVFWANMNAFSDNLDGVQVQRGVGTSTNGSGAFGATVTMQSESPAMDPAIQLSTRGGSYGTFQYGVKASSGLLDDRWVFDGRFSHTLTDGYIDRTAGNLGSYYGAASCYGDDWVVKLKNFGSYEHVQQAWNGVPSDSIAAGNRTYNSLGRYTDSSGDVHWHPTTDNYIQNNTQLSYVGMPTEGLTIHGVLHYTYGSGYYDDYKADDAYYKYKMESYTNSVGQEVSSGDVIRQKWLRNHNAGLIADIRYKANRLTLTSGFSASYFHGLHWGEVSNAINYPLHILSHYYDSEADKSEAAVFAKVEYQLADHLFAYGDLQYRYIDYSITGINDKFTSDHIQQTLDIHESFPFFNPKTGISWRTKRYDIYASAARTHREPTRNNYTDAGTSNPLPQSETLNDLEVGYNFHWTASHNPFAIAAGINAYWMDYDNQLIQTGQLSDIGEALTCNVAQSYRCGLELTARAQYGLLAWDGNCTLSRNRILDFTEYVDNWDGSPIQAHYDKTDIAFSPSVIAASSLRIGKDDLWGSITTNYVGRQYLDNTRCLERSLEAYCVTGLQLGYDFTLQTYYSQTADFSLTLNVNNLFGARYATGGWIYTAVSESCGYTLDNRYREDGLFVQAPFCAFIGLTIKI